MSYKTKLLNKIQKHVTDNYLKLDIDQFVLGEMPYNCKCHLNSVQKVKQKVADDVYLCMILQKGYTEPIVHFINKKDENYIDNTLGWLYTDHDYYIIRKVEYVEYIGISKLLNSTRDRLLNLYSTEWIRKLLLPKDLVI